MIYRRSGSAPSSPRPPRRTTDDKCCFKFHHLRGLARPLQTPQHLLHSSLAHLVVRLVYRGQSRIIPFSNLNVVIADNRDVLRYSAIAFFQHGDGSDGSHVIRCHNGGRRYGKLHQLSSSVSPVFNVPSTGCKQLRSNRLSPLLMRLQETGNTGVHAVESDRRRDHPDPLVAEIEEV